MPDDSFLWIKLCVWYLMSHPRQTPKPTGTGDHKSQLIRLESRRLVLLTWQNGFPVWLCFLNKTVLLCSVTSGGEGEENLKRHGTFLPLPSAPVNTVPASTVKFQALSSHCAKEFKSERPGKNFAHGCCVNTLLTPLRNSAAYINVSLWRFLPYC